jgi:hypothetical protein
MELLPAQRQAASLGELIVEVVRSAEDKVSTVEHKTGLDNDAVLINLSPGLVPLGYAGHPVL